ncbi:hypothetical protein LZ023_39200 (plasmid) [Pseudomonas silvicola]|nr:hypothetical protein LZ023_39200 [Pseudomonas silvicola]
MRYGLWLLLRTALKTVTKLASAWLLRYRAFSRHFRDAFGYPPSLARKQAALRDQQHVDPFFIHIDSAIEGR